MITVAWVPASHKASPAKLGTLSTNVPDKLPVWAKPVLETTEFGDVKCCFLAIIAPNP